MVGGLVFRKGQPTNVTTRLKGVRIYKAQVNRPAIVSPHYRSLGSTATKVDDCNAHDCPVIKACRKSCLPIVSNCKKTADDCDISPGRMWIRAKHFEVALILSARLRFNSLVNENEYQCFKECIIISLIIILISLSIFISLLRGIHVEIWYTIGNKFIVGSSNAA